MESKLKGRIVTVLRKAWLRDKVRTEVKERCRVGRGLYRCEMCKNVIGAKEFQIDHIEPAVPLTGWEGFDSFILRLFVSAKQLQLICKEPCHKNKTNYEKDQRKLYRKKRVKK